MPIIPGKEFLGLTTFDQIFGAGLAVFPDRATAPLENGVNLSGLIL